MAPRFPPEHEAACNTTPTVVMTPVSMRLIRRPYLSAIHGVTRQAAKHPAWRVETTAKEVAVRKQS